MKLFAALLGASNAAVDCDVSAIYDDAQYNLKGGIKGVTFENKGKLLKNAKILKHVDGSKDFSDYGIQCANDKKKTGILKCSSTGVVDATLPDCTEVGCDINDLGTFNSRMYDGDDGCRKGYFDISGLEKHENTCFRYCQQPDGGQKKSERKIRCDCDESGCSYKFRKGGELFSLTAVKGNGKNYITPCEEVPTTTTPEPTTPEATTVRETTTVVPEPEDWQCSSQILINDDELAMGFKHGDMSWDCTDGLNHESVCTKSCPVGYLTGGSKQTKECFCRRADNCKWKWNVSSCKPAVCQLEPERSWPDTYWKNEIVCHDKAGEKLDYLAMKEVDTFPYGAVCQANCKETEMPMTWHDSTSSCECDFSNGRCKFTVRKMAYCTPAYCDDDMGHLLSYFAEGFSGSEAGAQDNFNPLVCDQRWPEDAEDPKAAGRPKIGAKCILTCEDGHHLTDEDFGKETLELNCHHDGFSGGEFDLISNNLDDYGDCSYEWYTDCEDFPSCAVTNGTMY